MSFYDYDDPYISIQRTDKSIILDLDETLISTFEANEIKKLKSLGILTEPKYINLRSRLYVLNLKDINIKGENDNAIEYGFTRPHLDDFLKFCSHYFKHIIVWSAGCYDYVHEICKYIFKDLEPPALIYTRADCENNHKLKPLKKLIKNHPELGLSLEKMFVIDDKTYTFQDNTGNAILMPPYQLKTTIKDISNDDQTLPRLIEWFQQKNVANAKDVTKLNKDIFEQAA